MKPITLLATLVVIPFGLAIAADPTAPAPAKPRRDPAQIFKLVDRDADGFVSLEEFKISTVKSIDPSRVGDVFKKKDADGDGKLTLSEYMFVPPREVPKPAAPSKEKKPKTDAAPKTEAASEPAPKKSRSNFPRQELDGFSGKLLPLAGCSPFNKTIEDEIGM